MLRRLLPLAFSVLVALAGRAEAAGYRPWLFDEDASNHLLLRLHHLTLVPTSEPSVSAGQAPCWFDVVGMDWTCRSPMGPLTHGVQSSLPGGNFIIGIGPDGYVYRGGVSATQVAGIWPVALTGNGSDLNPLSTPLDRLSQSGATDGQVASYSVAQGKWIASAPATTGISQLTGQVLAGPGSGSQVATLATNTVTNANLRQSAGFSVMGNPGAGLGNVQDIVASGSSQVLKTNVAGTSVAFGSFDYSELTGRPSFAAIATSGSASDLIAGTVPAARFPALIGPVTTTAGSLDTALNLAAGSVSGALPCSSMPTLSGAITNSGCVTSLALTFPAGIQVGNGTSTLTGYSTTAGQVQVGAASGGGLVGAPNLAFSSNIFRVGDGTTATQSYVIASATNAAATQYLKDMTPTFGAGTGDGVPGAAPTNDLVFSTYSSGAGWTERGRFVNGAGLQVVSLAGASDAITYATAANGTLTRLTLGSGLSLVSGTLSATGAVSSVSGTTGQINVSPTTGAVVVSLPAVVSSGSCTFCSATIDGTGRVTAFANSSFPSGIEVGNGTSVLTGFGAVANQLLFGAASGGGPAQSPNLAFVSNAFTLGDGTTPTYFYSIATPSTSAASQFWADAAHSTGVAFGNGIPGAAPGTSATISTLSGSTWTRRMSIGPAGNLLLDSGTVQVPGVTASSIVKTDGSHFLASAAAGTDYVRTFSQAAPLFNSGSAADVVLGINDFGASGASHARGTVPDPGSTAGTTRFLREDGTWTAPRQLQLAFFGNTNSIAFSGTQWLPTSNSLPNSQRSEYGDGIKHATCDLDVYLAFQSIINDGSSVTLAVTRDGTALSGGSLTFTSSSTANILYSVSSVATGSVSSSDHYGLSWTSGGPQNGEIAFTATITCE